MEITEIRIKLMEESEDRLRAFCSITLDDSFVIRDLKIIDGSAGVFVAMPSRKLTSNCHRCRHKNQVRASYCNYCGSKQRSNGNDGGSKLYADVAHPINSECREMIQSAVLDEFENELDRSQQPGYRSRYDDEFLDAESANTKVDEAEPSLPKPHLSREKADDRKPNDQMNEPVGEQNTTSDSDVAPVTRVDILEEPDQPPRAHQHQTEDRFGEGIF